uniref:SAM domain-containing protein n=1 Tax=Dunaliella tertiolecta TaxID=3047 RepID=A0A7S3RAC6_DUNTE|mmetsp:Transcript_6795/g.18249  ORF Transcript_6795/g.18249 Transcript_6795/m.18249 type:complete len:641 (-) Transcript_6795:809-2731(-)
MSLYSDIYETEFLHRLTLRRLAELERTRARLHSLELARYYEESEAERRRLSLLYALDYPWPYPLDVNATAMSHYVAQLKAYLQSVYDADLMGDVVLQELAVDHAVGYMMRLLASLTEPAIAHSLSELNVLELATSTLTMFSQRPSASRALYDSGITSLAVKLLSPLLPTVAVVNVANAMGNLAAETDIRLGFRAAGGVGALVRLLRPDVEPTAQTAAAAALSLLASRDMVIQDSVRYLGGIEFLVDLLASPDAYLSEVAKYTLLALRHGNVKNQSEIITTIRASPLLARDYRKMDYASDLLHFEDSTPIKAPLPYHGYGRVPRYGNGTASDVRSLIHEMSDYHEAKHGALQAPLRPSTMESPRLSAYTARPYLDPMASPRDLSPLPSMRAALNASPTRPYVPSALRSPPPPPYSPRCLSPRALAPIPPSPCGSPRPRSPGPSSPRPMLTKDAAHNLLSSRPYTNSSLFRDPSRDMASTNDDWRVNSLVEVESDLLRKKHLARFTPDELALLLEEMGFDRLDLRGFRINHISGATLLAMSEDDMAVDLVLPRSKTRKLRALQRATHLFDRIATLPRQGKISEVELRLFLASQGAGTAEVDKVVKLFKTLVRTDKYDFVTFWDFVTSYDWIAQALRIYNIPT